MVITATKKGKIAPHLDRELELMLEGKKPLAMMDKKDINKFSPYVKSGVFIHAVIEILGDGAKRYRGKNYAYALRNEKWRLSRLQEIYDRAYERGYMIDEDHIGIGKLLGYSDEDIAAFLVPFDQRK